VSITTVTDSENLVLSGAYSGTAGSTISENFRIRKVYSTPTNEKPWYTIVADKFCFGNGNINAQQYTGSGYATDLETGAATATKARYGIEYANRLVIADYGSTRDPLGFAWSKENDPTDWTDATYGEAQLLQSMDYITGLGEVGAGIIIYKRDSHHVGNRTGRAFDPIEIPLHRLGRGNITPASLIHYGATTK